MPPANATKTDHNADDVAWEAKSIGRTGGTAYAGSENETKHGSDGADAVGWWCAGHVLHWDTAFVVGEQALRRLEVHRVDPLLRPCAP